MSNRINIRNTKIGRDSTRTLSRYGSEQSINNGRTTSINELGLSSIDISSAALSTTGLVSTSFKSSEFDVAFSYFEKKSGSRRLARTMAAVSLDISSILGVDINTVIYSIASNDESMATIRNKATNIMNKLRDPSEQHMFVRKTSNLGKPRSRLVSP